MRRSKGGDNYRRRLVGAVAEAEPVAGLEEHVHLMQIHPLPESCTGVLSVANYLVRRFAAEQGREVPGLSKDAANYLATRSWALEDLARRLWRAVTISHGSLITASDLSD